MVIISEVELADDGDGDAVPVIVNHIFLLESLPEK